MRPDRNAIYEAVIRRMVNEGLGQKEEAFALAHAEDSDAELLIYLRRSAAELGHTPWPKEIVGWMYITERFGDWPTALRKAYLPQPRTANHPSAFKLVQDEVEIQKKNYRRNKAEKKEKSAKKRKASREKRAQRSVPPCAEAVNKEAV